MSEVETSAEAQRNTIGQIDGVGDIGPEIGVRRREIDGRVSEPPKRPNRPGPNAGNGRIRTDEEGRVDEAELARCVELGLAVIEAGAEDQGVRAPKKLAGVRRLDRPAD